jgi:6-phosphogluconolactonase
VKEVWVEQKQTWRISFTLPLINKAAQIIFLVQEKKKQQWLQLY